MKNENKYKISDEYKIINDVKIYNETNEKLFTGLIDLEGYNTGDFFVYNDLLFVLVGEYLYGINNTIVIPATLSLVDTIEKVNLTDYILNREYLTPCFYNCRGVKEKAPDSNKILSYIFDNNAILDRLLISSYKNIIAYDEWQEDSKSKFSFNYGNFISNIKDMYCILGQNKSNDKTLVIKNGNLEISTYDDNYIYRTTKIENISTVDFNKYKNEKILNLDEIDKIIEKFESKKEYKNYFKEILKEDKEFNLNDEQFNKRKKNYENIYNNIDELVHNIKKNAKVIKQLKSGITILNCFLYQNTNVKTTNCLAVELTSKQIGIYDYSFLIMNFIKAVEIFLTYKLSKFNGEMQIYNKENKKREIVNLNSDTFKKYSMLGDMINYLIDHSSEVFNNDFNVKDIDRFLLLIKEWKDKERNGFFHKHKVKSINEALEIILSSLQIIVGLELYLKEKNYERKINKIIF